MFTVLQIMLGSWPRHRNTTKTGHGVFLWTSHPMVPKYNLKHGEHKPV